MNPDTKREVYRKLLHMSMGLFALCLRWLTPWQAALCALAALLHNLYLFPFYGYKKLLRPEEKARGYSGMIGYPAVVLVLILASWAWAFKELGEEEWVRGLPGGWKDIGLPLVGPFSLILASGAWAYLAVGDACGAICGIFLGGPRLPWNTKKTWTGMAGFFIFGTLGAWFMVRFVSGRNSLDGLLWVFLLAGFVAAVVETLPGQIDDNLTVPIAAWIVLAMGLGLHWITDDWIQGTGHVYSPPFTLLEFLVLLALNAGLAAIAFWRGWVDKWGFLLGLVFGAIVAFGTGIPGYSLLLLFYLVANGSTYYGKKVKEQRGIAEAHGGQRRTGSVFSKGFAPSLFALLSFPAFVASLATYAADTAASEFGKTSTGRTFSLKQWKVVPAGSVGAISLKGTLAGLFTLALFGVAAWFCCGFHHLFSCIPTVSGFPFLGFAFATLFCFFFESWFNEWNAPRQYFSKEVIHVMLGFLAGMLTYAPEVLRAVFLALKGTLS